MCSDAVRKMPVSYLSVLSVDGSFPLMSGRTEIEKHRLKWEPVPGLHGPTPSPVEIGHGAIVDSGEGGRSWRAPFERPATVTTARHRYDFYFMDTDRPTGDVRREFLHILREAAMSGLDGDTEMGARSVILHSLLWLTFIILAGAVIALPAIWFFLDGAFRGPIPAFIGLAWIGLVLRAVWMTIGPLRVA
jgi:hypothetical protein